MLNILKISQPVLDYTIELIENYTDTLVLTSVLDEIISNSNYYKEVLKTKKQTNFTKIRNWVVDYKVKYDKVSKNELNYFLKHIDVCDKCYHDNPSYPCHHYCRIEYSINSSPEVDILYLYGNKIKYIISQLNLEIPRHFSNYQIF